MRASRYDKFKSKLRRRRSVDVEEADSEADPEYESDVALLKSVGFLFLGGLCIAGAVYLFLVSTIGGSAPLPPAPQAPSPQVNETQPGHKFWWTLLKAYDYVADRIGQVLDKRRQKQKELQENYEPPKDDNVSKVVVEEWESGLGTGREERVAPKQSTEKPKKAASTPPTATRTVIAIADSDDSDSDDSEVDDGDRLETASVIFDTITRVGRN